MKFLRFLHFEIFNCQLVYLLFELSDLDGVFVEFCLSTAASALLLDQLAIEVVALSELSLVLNALEAALGVKICLRVADVRLKAGEVSCVCKRVP